MHFACYGCTISSGAGISSPGSPIPAFEHTFDAWPVPSLEATPYYFGADGTLLPEPPTGSGADSYIYDPSNSQRTTFDTDLYSSGLIWAALPPWDWQPLPDGKAVAYATPPLEEDTVMVGSASVDLWVPPRIVLPRGDRNARPSS